MARQEENDEKPRGNRVGVNINAWIDAETALAFDNFLASQKVETKKNAVVKKALREFFQRQGHLPLQGTLFTDQESDELPPNQLPRPTDIFPLYRLPYVGVVSTGTRPEAFEQTDEWFHLPKVLGTDGRYVFKIKGNHLANYHILSGDYLIIRRDPQPHYGDSVIAIIDEEFVFGSLFRNDDGDFVYPAGESSPSAMIDGIRGDYVLGTFLGVLRLAPRK